MTIPAISVAMKLLLSFSAAFLSIVPSLVSAEVYHTNSRWILDSSNNRYKMRCVNWAGHLEANVPEGLHHKPIDTIAAWIANAGFNCVRLTYSIDMALSPNTTVSSSFTNAGTVSGVGADALNAVYAQALIQNPWLSTATTRSTFGSIITALGNHGVNVILDNHVSKASWCCNLTDGNGWWAQASIYVAANSQYFDVPKWLAGLSAMATWAAQFPNVMGMSLRNEIRPFPILQDSLSHSDWYNYVNQAANAIHNANSNLLIVIGGTNSATDMSYLRINPLNTSAWTSKVVWEFHSYSFTVGFSTTNCGVYVQELGAVAGYLLTQNEAYTGPLWLSEFGVSQNGANGTLSDDENAYLTCLVNYVEGNDADWAVWAIQGDYYVREGTLGYVESYGILDSTWSDWQNPKFKAMLGTMWNINQTP